MPSWSAVVARVGQRLDLRADTLRARMRHRLGLDYAPIQILPYRSFGTAEHLEVMGRVLESSGDTLYQDDDTWWDNLVNMYRRFNSREVFGAEVQATLGDLHGTTTSGSDGYFRIKLRAPQQGFQTGWFKVDLELTNAADYAQAKIHAQAEILVPPATAEVGIISDIDDTIVLTHATETIKMARMVFLNSAHSRLPFSGVAAFYQALCAGSSELCHNPIFYVSSSAWNTYDLLVDFMTLNDIPAGPLLLADYGLGQESFPFSSHDRHKLAQIERVLITYPHLNFVLVGDSGQRDREIYRQVVANFPGRVRAIYIREVQWLVRNGIHEPATLEQVAPGVDMVLAPHTLAAAKHAAKLGLINPARLDAIAADTAKDEGAPDEVEMLLDDAPPPVSKP